MRMDHDHGCGGKRGGARSEGRHGGWQREAVLSALGAKIASKMGGRHAHGMRRQRMFDGGELRLLLLKLIGDEPRHGYELIKAIEEMTGGGYAPSPGTIYPTLTLLNEMGHVSSEDVGGGRRKFTITPEGEAHLASQAELVAKIIARLSALGEQQKHTDGAPVRRAMGNLKAALQGRLSRGDASDAMLLEVAALIDEAAQKIERL
ncbi:PadR family transcriptional regulator [Sphingomonas radiodurans]|uniref:PadR family transcriptional regulator n=1 Tax=Sphingomonas radiodurans TaxID=2890321 RepID=UPI001E40C777|nr:PadR family transcriptional regulator [Sphingomonas radiodurans]WBH16724.1 PadR family transcriptional regulator [Sphingomonas radiodurans]